MTPRSRCREDGEDCMNLLKNKDVLDHLIVGGGLAGMTIAVSLLKKSYSFCLLEATARLGGKVETQLTPEACFEFGPSSFIDQPPDILDLLKVLDLHSEILKPSPAAQNRYILKNGVMTRLPLKPPEMLTTKALSFKGRLRFLSEIFYVPQGKKEDESVWDFFARHFGHEIADYFADPFVSGIFAGDAKNLSLKSAFPTMAEAEVQSTSLIRYLMAQRKTAKASPQSYQLKDGLESIFHRALEKIGADKIHFSEKVVDIIPGGDTLQVITDRAAYETKRLFLTTPAYVTAKILQRSLPEASRLLEKIDYAPVVTVHLKVSRQESFSFDGFGILLPSLEKRKILGALWNSSTFPSLFHDKDFHYLTVYVGGAHYRDGAMADEAVIQKIVCDEIKDILQLKNPPHIIQMRRHAKAIPQYTLGYEKILKSIKDSLASYPSVRLAGNYWGGISMSKTVAYAMQTIAVD